MKESVSNAKIQEWLKSEGAYVIKTITTNRSGVPDILACLDGRFIAIEGKTEKGIAAALQEVAVMSIQEAGGFAMIAYNVEEVKEAITAWRVAGYTQPSCSGIRDNLRFTL